MIMERSDVVSRDPEVLQGDLVFTGTRVPAAYLLDYLWDDAIDQVLLDYPSVGWEQVEGLLAAACGALQRLHAAPRAEEVSATADEVVVRLRSGDVVRVPLALYPILAAASPEERARWELIGGGVGMRWRTLDEDVPVHALVHPGSGPSVDTDELKRRLERQGRDPGVITRVLDDDAAARKRLEMDSRTDTEAGPQQRGRERRIDIGVSTQSPFGSIAGDVARRAATQPRRHFVAPVERPTPLDRRLPGGWPALGGVRQPPRHDGPGCGAPHDHGAGRDPSRRLHPGRR